MKFFFEEFWKQMAPIRWNGPVKYLVLLTKIGNEWLFTEFSNCHSNVLYQIHIIIYFLTN